MEQPRRRRTRAKTAAEPENAGTTQSHEIYLTYDILRIVFRYLNGKDLASVAMVCRSWLEAANNEKWIRGPHCFIECYKECPRHILEGMFLDNVVCSSLRNTDTDLKCIKESTIRPSIGFFFIPIDIPRDIRGRICHLLPKNCEVIMLFTRNIVMNNLEMEHPFPHMVCALLPQIPDVRINTLKITEKNLAEEERQKYIKMIQEASVPNHEKSTCLMLFCNYQGHSMASYLASLAQLCNGDGIVSLWGGVVEDMQYIHIKRGYEERFNEEERFSREENTMPYCVAIMITGSIQTWSIIVDKKCRTKEQVEAKLTLFKNQVKLKKHSVGFMFACIARGSHMYHEANVESTIFKALFPEVPLVGCFGNGEFGKNTTTVDETDKLKGNVKGLRKKNRTSVKHPYKIIDYSKIKGKQWHNEFSTMFMILTYG